MSADVDPDALALLTEMAAARDEELHPELAACLEETAIGPMIKHPLVYSVLPVNGWVNKHFAAKQAALAEAIEAEDWHTVVFLHERPYRCTALIDYVLGRDEDWKPIPVDVSYPQEDRDLVVDVWTDSENIHQHVDDWMRITSGWSPGDPLLFASEEEREAFAALPETLTLWRGDCDDGGWSWSLERKVGEFFAKRFSANHALLTGTVSKRDVFGYITRRNEAEVMVRREHVHDIVYGIVSGNEE